MTEFDLIRTYFSRLGAYRADVLVGIGDDCALLKVPKDARVAVSIDTLVAGVHFLPDCDPESIGHKALAVGLSDLAAMGAQPAWATLALTLPRMDADWLRAFAAGFSALARRHGVALVGGDTTRGPLTISVQVHGLITGGYGLRRCGAFPGNLIFVSGTLGDAGLALRRLQAGEAIPERVRQCLERPRPRVALGMALTGLATAAIDLSDGLAADLGHLLQASGVAADVHLGDLPLAPEVAEEVAATGDWSLPLSFGDDYELCFTLSPRRLSNLKTLAKKLDCPLRAIGRITHGAGLRCHKPEGTRWEVRQPGFDHFSDNSGEEAT